MDPIRPLRVLHLEDDSCDAELVRRVMERHQLSCQTQVVASHAAYFDALTRGDFDLVLSDTGVSDIDGVAALDLARERRQDIPFVFVSGRGGEQEFAERMLERGASACVPKSDLGMLAPTLRRIMTQRGWNPPHQAERYLQGMERLVLAVQELSLARDLPAVMAIVRSAARELTGADGATFILRDGEQCHYADEDAIAPLWKGKRFPLLACISGWAMLNRQAVVIEDIYADPRIPHEAYRDTFVKSLAMVPVRILEPVAAIGNYWAETHVPSAEELKLLQALADTTAVAMENVRVHAELERRVAERTTELAEINRELEAFCAAISHDLRAPLRHIDGFAQALAEDCAGQLKPEGNEHLRRIQAAARRMSQLIDDLLGLSRATQHTLRRERLDLSAMAREICEQLSSASPSRQVQIDIADGLYADGDPRLMHIALENLLSNAWKFTSKTTNARIEIGTETGPDGRPILFVRDNGAGFDMAYADKLFGVFQRLHAPAQFPGSGIGLATAQRVIHKHGGRIWASAAIDQGATFFFTLS